MDKRINNGGSRANAGRPTKATEITLIKAIDRHINTETLLKKVVKIIDSKDARDSDKLKAIAMLLEYRWGKPKQKLQVQTNLIEPVIFIDATEDNTLDI